MILLLDQGNSYLKLAYAQSAKDIGQVESVANSDLETFDFGDRQPRGVWVSNVGGKDKEDVIVKRCRDLWSLEPHFVISQKKWQDLDNGYIQPESLGVDRWLSMVAARSLQKEFLLLSAGTAITLDCVRGTRHEGGLILPGLNSLADYFRQVFPQLDFRMDFTAGLDLARSTSEGISAGMLRQVVASIESVAQELNVNCIICTGGQGKMIGEILRSRRKSWQILLEPNLVLRGLSRVVPW